MNRFFVKISKIIDNRHRFVCLPEIDSAVIWGGFMRITPEMSCRKWKSVSTADTIERDERSDYMNHRNYLYHLSYVHLSGNKGDCVGAGCGCDGRLLLPKYNP